MDFWQSFWDIIWWFVWGFVFISYLIVLFQVVADLFRDRKLSGWAKAVWMVCLVFVPFATAVVYLIARGRGMAERSVQAAETSRKAAESYIRDVAGATPSDEIAKAKELLDSGSITETEYNALKAQAISGGPHPITEELGRSAVPPLSR